MLGLKTLHDDFAAAGRAKEHTLSDREQAPKEAAPGELNQYAISIPVREDSSTADEATNRAMLIDLVLVMIRLEQRYQI